MRGMSIDDQHFDRAYYRRYYHDRETAVVDKKMQRTEVAFVLAFCSYIGVEIKSFTDVGAGTGWWGREFTRRYPSCERVETLDASAAACDAYGHRRARVEKLSGSPSDLVVCRDVLRYVTDPQADEAIRRLAKKCRGVLYLHVITSNDDIDEEMSDMSGYFRKKSWYLTRLRAAGFTDCGMGLFASKRFDFQPFAIEAR